MLELSGVAKSFGGTRALTSVELEVGAGEVHALIGENGAGKSTLLKILAGVHRSDAGKISLRGGIYQPRDPSAARRSGVAMVHQELSLCPHLTVAENVLLGEEPTFLGFVRIAEARARVVKALARVTAGSAAISPDIRVGDLPTAAQQLVEIARALVLPGVRVLILDEPTSSLGQDDAARLFSLIRALRDEGLSVLYVSHFLDEVQRVADRFTVLRDGASVMTGAMASASLSSIIEAMAGRAIDELFPRTAHHPGEALLSIRGLASHPREGSNVQLRDASLTVHRGEVVGIAGLVGAGRTELLRSIFGLDRVRSGEVKIGTFPIAPPSPARRLAKGVGLLSEDRKGEGLAVGLSIADNLTLSRLPFVVTPRAQAEVSRRFIDELSVKCSSWSQPIGDLSGGNQQKIALARLLHHEVDVFLLDEPTRGIDVASKALIYARIDALASAGKAVLMVSSYLPELLGVCDRIAVMHKGKLGEARNRADWSEAKILAEATGA